MRRYLADVLRQHGPVVTLMAIRSHVHDSEPPTRLPDATMIIPIDPWLGWANDDTTVLPVVARGVAKCTGPRSRSWLARRRKRREVIG